MEVSIRDDATVFKPSGTDGEGLLGTVGIVRTADDVSEAGRQLCYSCVLLVLLLCTP